MKCLQNACRAELCHAGIEVSPYLGDDDASRDGHGSGPNVVLEPVAGKGPTDGGGDVCQSRLVETYVLGVPSQGFDLKE